MGNEIIKKENATISLDTYTEVRGYNIKAQQQVTHAVNSEMVTAY